MYPSPTRLGLALRSIRTAWHSDGRTDPAEQRQRRQRRRLLPFLLPFWTLTYTVPRSASHRYIFPRFYFGPPAGSSPGWGNGRFACSRNSAAPQLAADSAWLSQMCGEHIWEGLHWRTGHRRSASQAFGACISLAGIDLARGP